MKKNNKIKQTKQAEICRDEWCKSNNIPIDDCRQITVNKDVTYLYLYYKDCIILSFKNAWKGETAPIIVEPNESIENVNEQSYYRLCTKGRTDTYQQLMYKTYPDRIPTIFGGLNEQYIIHHINFDRHDNRPENLIRMPISLHQKLHFLCNDKIKDKLSLFEECIKLVNYDKPCIIFANNNYMLPLSTETKEGFAPRNIIDEIDGYEAVFSSALHDMIERCFNNICKSVFFLKDCINNTNYIIYNGVLINTNIDTPDRTANILKQLSLIA